MEQEIVDRLTRIEGLARIGAQDSFSIEDLALYLNRSKRTIKNRLDEIPHYKGGLGVRFKKKEIDAWLCQVKCATIRF